MTLPLRFLLTWARARTRVDQRGWTTQSVLITILVVLAIIALLFWLITSFQVAKK